MTLTIRWWMVAILLVLIPVIYATFRKPQSGYDLQMDTMLVAVLCWALAIGLTIGKVL
jgi:hypothetical protein